MTTDEQPTESALENGTNANKAKELKRMRVHSEYILPSDRHPFSVHFEILKRFVARAGKGAVAADDVEGTGIPVQSAAMNVRFLSSIGLLRAEKRGLYSATQPAIDFIYARSVDENRAKPILRDILQNQWFTEVAKTHLKLDPITTRAKLIGELALDAKTDMQIKGPALGVIVDYLVYSGILAEDERGITPGSAIPVVAPTNQEVVSGVVPGPSIPSVTSPQSPVSEMKPVQSSTSTEGWHIIQTEDFYVKVRSNLDAVSDLKDQLELLEKKVKRIKEKQVQQSATSEPSEGVSN